MIRAIEPEGWREDHARERDQGIRKRTFTVVGDTKVKGKSKGETVVLEMPEANIDILINAGCIQEQGYTRVIGDQVSEVLGIDPPIGEAVETILAPLKEDVEAAHVHYVQAADSVETKDVAGTAPGDKRATRAHFNNKKG